MQNGTRGNSPAAQTIPSHRLATFSHSLKSSIGFLQSHMPRTSPRPERFIKTSAPLPTLFKREMLLSKWNENVKKWCGLWAIGFETLSVRAAVFDSYIFINFRLEKTENSPTSKKILRGCRMKTGDFERELVKLEVPVADVGADGEIV